MSDPAFDHLAFAYFPEQQIAAIPVDAYGEDGIPVHRLVVFKVSREEGIRPLGEVELTDWVWGSLRIGGILYAVALDALKAAGLESPATVLGELSLRGAEG